MATTSENEGELNHRVNHRVHDFECFTIFGIMALVIEEAWRIRVSTCYGKMSESGRLCVRLGEKPEKEVFRFVPVEVTCDDKGFTKWSLSSASGNRFLFEITDTRNYQEAIGSAPHEKLYASNANLTFDRTAMNDKFWAAVLRVYCGKGAHMIQPNCNSVEELLDAQKHPERHQNLNIRVCGFSARFIALSKRWQNEVIARHRLR